MAPRNFEPPELFQMWREPLCIEQDKLARAQTFHQRHKRNLGRIGYAMKHRFAKERTADCDAVKAASERVLFPSFN